MNKRSAILMLVSLMSWGVSLRADTKEKLTTEVQDGMALFQKADSSLKKFFDTAFGYAVFPNVGKGAIGLGAAHGKGQAFEQGKLIGEASLSQVTVGFQLGGQTYAEIVFFENQKALDGFKENHVEFSAQVSAVVAAEGASQNARYRLGVAVFTLPKNGLMFEASIGGQKFKFKPYK